MIQGARYVHTNLIARDWRRLAEFYQSVFGCVPVPPERNLSGPQLESGTGVPGAAIAGMHLRLPGGGADGPTLEIFSYARVENGRRPPSTVPASRTSRSRWRRSTGAPRCHAGGAAVGEVVTMAIAGGGRVTGATSPIPSATSSSCRPGRRAVVFALDS